MCNTAVKVDAMAKATSMEWARVLYKICLIETSHWNNSKSVGHLIAYHVTPYTTMCRTLWLTIASHELPIFVHECACDALKLFASFTHLQTQKKNNKSTIYMCTVHRVFPLRRSPTKCFSRCKFSVSICVLVVVCSIFPLAIFCVCAGFTQFFVVNEWMCMDLVKRDSAATVGASSDDVYTESLHIKWSKSFYFFLLLCFFFRFVCRK